MSSDLSTKPHLDFEAVAARAKQALGARTDGQLARALGLSETAFSNRKKTSSFPVEELAVVLHGEGLSVDLVLFGSTPSSTAWKEIDKDRLEAIIERVEHCLAEREAALAPPLKAKLVVLLYSYFESRPIQQSDFDRFLTLILKG